MSFYDDMGYYFMPRQTTPFGNGAAQAYPQGQQMSQTPAMQQTMPALPSGVPGGPMVGALPMAPSTGGSLMSAAADLEPAATTLQSTLFVPGYLKTQIGKTVRVEFLIGSTGPLVDRVGTLVGVGTSYILIRPIESDDVLLCDMYSIKFVTFLM